MQKFFKYNSELCHMQKFFKYNSELCHMQKFSDDTEIVGCVRNGQEREYRSLVEDFVEWCTTNHLKLNITKTKEMCIDFRRFRPSQQPISIKGVDVEVVRSYKYLGVHLDERLDWSVNTDMVYKKAQSRLYFLRRLGSFRICQKLLLMFYQSVVASVLFYAVVCWGGSISRRDAGRLDRLVRKAGSVLGLELESLTPLAGRRALNKLLNNMDNAYHPLHSTIIRSSPSKLVAWSDVLALLFPAIVGGLTDLGLQAHVFHLVVTLSGVVGFRGSGSLTLMVRIKASELEFYRPDTRRGYQGKERAREREGEGGKGGGRKQ
ncbi:hypothetical protein NFI96_024962 [Prochilodus magdalenae]|nr:hypothetical protein NFI96_024962 [Prochilodus magdalenae]